MTSVLIWGTRWIRMTLNSFGELIQFYLQFKSSSKDSASFFFSKSEICNLIYYVPQFLQSVYLFRTHQIVPMIIENTKLQRENK